MGFRYCAGVTQRLIKVVLFTHFHSEIEISFKLVILPRYVPESAVRGSEDSKSSL
jgi:hypothetical protein